MDNKEILFKGLYNIEAEQIILGKIISNNDYYEKIEEFLDEESFYELAHREIFKYVKKTIKKASIIADSITLKNFFDNNEVLASIGGSNYLSIILSMSAGIFDIVSYAKMVQDLYIKRKIIEISEDSVNRINSDKSENAFDEIEKTETELFNLSNNNSNLGKSFSGIASAITETINNINLARSRDSNISGVPSNLLDLDMLLGGFQNSDLVILAGRPSMGKTTLAINFAYNAAIEFKKEADEGKEKKSVGIFSLEMPANQIAAKILSIETSLSTEKFRKGEVEDNDFTKIVEKANTISSLPIFIDDTPSLTISSIKTRIRRLIKQENLGFVVIDYLQLIHGTKDSSKSNRVLEISEITQGLKAIAKEFNIPIIALSQLSRQTEIREDKRPQLADLRESGSIEQDADVVMLIYREVYYEERKKPSESDEAKFKQWQYQMNKLRNKCEVIVAKHRNGAIGNIDLFFNPEISKFADSGSNYE